MARHRGTYKPDHDSPYEVSRSRIEAFINCPAENKVVIFKKYLDTNRYARIRLFDDSLENLKAFLQLQKSYPNTEFTAYKVYKNGRVRIL
jgi:hypothetical protein